MLLYGLQDVILERKKKTKKIDLSRLKVATKLKSRLQQVRCGRSGRIREKSRLSKPTHGRSSCGNTNPRLIKELDLHTYLLEKPRQVQNVDGMNNRLGKVTKEAKFQVCHESHCQVHQFLIANIREDSVILSYPFFEAANPMVDWPTGKVHGALVLTEIQPTPVLDTRLNLVSQIIAMVKKTNIAQQLAIEASNKQEKTWQELVPQQYHKSRSIFSENDSK